MENLLSDKHDWKIVISVLGETRIVEDLILNKESLVFCKQISVANTTNGKAYVNCFKKSFASDLGQVREYKFISFTSLPISLLLLCKTFLFFLNKIDQTD
jgi:hypothetical protein